MARIRNLAGAGVVALALVACQSATSPSIPPVPSNLPSVIASAIPSDIASALPSLAPSASFNQLYPVFQARAGSNITGGAIITDIEGGASIIIGTVAPGVTDEMPVAIVEGDCASVEDQGPTPPPELAPPPSVDPSAAVASPAASVEPSPAASPTEMPTSFPMWLSNIAAGTSNSVIPVSISDLVASPHAMIVEMNFQDPTVIACADLAEGPPTLSSPQAGASGEPGASPEPEGSPASS